MKYNNIHKAVFRLRPNRFIAECELQGEKVEAHVRNTGRCRELLIPGCTVYLEKTSHSNRKTQYTLISVEKSDKVINMDSQAPNKVFLEAIENGCIELPNLDGPYNVVKPEKKYGDSRFDFYLESNSKKAFVEVKGVTLEEDGIVRFPDAPTERGIKHILELCKAKEEGYLSFLVFIVQMKNVRYLTPNWQTHPAFGEAMKFAQNSGVNLLSFDCHVTPDEIQIGENVEIQF